MLAPNLSTAVWHKARKSETAAGCVEVATLCDNFMAVRDSKNVAKAAHIYPVSDWQDLLAHLRGEHPTAGRIVVTVTDQLVLLSDGDNEAGQPHEYTFHEWACFLDGVHNREPQLIAA
ncbi:DUF397 domain-containing protein [Streptomyces europaeiscabiei]|uniref:DUF397 domain-containing protein n=1 Tax=Streptomyces europaeiscabiei TaxID=146819 RepID=UPI0029AA09B6|nr:DUF397 domain-containing protein [Streptomyces europaeiscabiei]MDX3694828.1 DUF397 domain-containing protein [Streptomyces europaeiscabiei]